LLKPTKIYVTEILPLIKKGLISAIAHITGGGIFENLERIIPDNFYAEIDSKKHKIPEPFLWLKSCGKISAEEMLRTFNCGLGLIIVVEKKKIEDVTKYFKKNKTKFQILGKVLRKKNESKKIKIKNFGEWNLT
jgi:phosphoribosylaminoimidazole (AIR) synthetase